MLGLLPGHSSNLNPFGAASIAAEDSNSRLRRFQKPREKLDQGVIGTVLDCRGLQANFQRASHFAGDFILAGAGLDADRKDRGASLFLNV